MKYSCNPFGSKALLLTLTAAIILIGVTAYSTPNPIPTTTIPSRNPPVASHNEHEQTITRPPKIRFKNSTFPRLQDSENNQRMLDIQNKPDVIEIFASLPLIYNDYKAIRLVDNTMLLFNNDRLTSIDLSDINSMSMPLTYY